MEPRPPVKPMLPPMPPKPITKPPYPYQPPYQPYRQQEPCVPCDPKMLHHMYRHMKMCHRYETHMMRWYIKWCKGQWKQRRYNRPYESSSSRYRGESSSSSRHHESQYRC